MNSRFKIRAIDLMVLLPIVGLIVIPSSIVGAAQLYARSRTQEV